MAPTIADPPPTETNRAAGPPTLSEASAILVLIGIFFAVLMGSMDGLVVSTALPTIANDLGQVNGVPFVVSGYLVSATIAIPIFARLSDMWSRRNVFLVGLGIFIVGSALAGLSQNLTQLIVFRSVQGFGGGGVFPVAIAMVAVLYRPEARTRAVAVLTGAAGIAIVAGPLLGSYIVSVTTWRWVFYINLPFGVFAALIVGLAVGPLRAANRGRFDVVGAVLVSGWVGALMIALVQVSSAGWGWTDPRIVGLLAATAVLFAAFLAWEVRTPEPLVPLRMFRRRVIASAGSIMLFTGVVFSALITFLSLYVGIVLGHSAGDIRNMIYFLAIPMILGAAAAGLALNRLPYRELVAPSLLASGIAGLFLATLNASTPLWEFSYAVVPTGGVAVYLIPMGFGLGVGFSGATIAVQNEAPAAEVGAAVGLTRFLQSLGGAIGISLLTIYQTWRFQQLSAGASSPADFLNALVSSYDEVFLALAACILIAFVAALWLAGRVSGREPSVSVEPRRSTMPPT